MERNANQQINILVVEDNPADFFLIDSILEESQVSYKLHHVLNGADAMAFLHREGANSSKPRPDLILLDLNLPRKHGFEVLQEIKSAPKVKMIPVIILTSSNSEQDILQSYNLFASCYVTKPLSWDDFTSVFKSLENFWLQFVRFPPKLEAQNI